VDDVTPDGSPVAFYRRLPPAGEPELVRAAIPAGATILDLGCGSGRIAAPLARLGHPVTGVDNGAGMIAALPPEVEGILGDARTIRLGRTFDVVLLASHLVDDPSDGRSFIETAAAHVTPSGTVIGETYPPGWGEKDDVGTTLKLGDATVTVVRARREGDLVDAAVRYGVDGMEWTQSYTARLLDEPALVALLADCGLAFAGWLEKTGWFAARPAR